jgi:hypothetical protein
MLKTKNIRQGGTSIEEASREEYRIERKHDGAAGSKIQTVLVLRKTDGKAVEPDLFWIDEHLPH